jgi:DNA-binding FrmR family transcriptional regulator
MEARVVVETLPAVADQRAIVARLNRANGQLGAVARMIDEGRDCEEVVGQLAAVSKAVNSVAFTLVFASLKQCLVEERSDAEDVSARLQKLLLALA